MTVRKEVIGDATLYMGDCMDVLPTIGNVDAFVADPPYGLFYNGSSTKHKVSKCESYIGYVDSPENVDNICVPAIVASRSLSTRGALFPCISNYRKYPLPDGEGVIWYPSGANRGRWGFITHQPIFYYGKCPYLSNRLGSRPTGFSTTEAAERNGHPCPKPIGQMKWVVARVSLYGETVLDPFMGSGTTGVACALLGRRFIGIEIEPTYFDIACRRIEEAYRQPRLAIEERAPAPTQADMLATDP